MSHQGLFSSNDVYLILPASVQSQSHNWTSIALGYPRRGNILKFVPLPCFWKCSTVHLPRVRIKVGWGEKRESCSAAHLWRGVKRKSHRLYKNCKSRPLVFFLLMKAKSFAAICLPVRNAHEWDSVGATLHVTLYIWASVCPCGVCGALEKGWWFMFLFGGFCLFVNGVLWNWGYA